MRNQSEIGNLALNKYLSIANDRVYYIDRMNHILFSDDPKMRDTVGKMKPQVYKTLAMTKTIYNSFPAIEQLKKRDKMSIFMRNENIKIGRLID